MEKEWTIVDAVLSHAETDPDKKAILFKKQEITYKDLVEMVKAGAVILRDEHGIKAGDRVIVSGLSKPEYIIAYLSVQYLGAVSIPADKSALGESLTHMCQYLRPSLFITDSVVDDPDVSKLSLREFYQGIVDRKSASDIDYIKPDMNEISEILFTTGTTGAPKGAMLSLNAVQHIAMNTINGTGRTESDIELIPLPLNHSFGMRVLRAMLYLGGTIVLQNGFMFMKETRVNIERFGCTGISIVAASIEMLYRSLGKQFTEVFGQLKRIEIGASSLSVSMKKRLITILPDVTLLDVWGSSETGGAIFLNATEHPEHLGSIGKPIEGVEVRLIDSNGNDGNFDSPENCGRMILRGEMEMSGYFGMEELTKETLIDGYLYTNDLAYCTDDGFIYMMGRADDIINVGGEKVSPVEVENAAALYENVRECACIGGSDKEGVYEQVPVLFVVSDAYGFDEQDMIHFLSSKLEQYKIPKYFVQITSLPRNRMMKIDRKELKRRWESSLEPIESNAVVTAIMGRRSVREFTDKPVPHEVLESLVECAVMAPTGHNRQTWRFTVIEDEEKIQRLKSLIKDAAARKKTSFYGFNEPQALILVSNDRRNDDGIQDSACAVENILLAAYSYGLGSSWVNALMTLSDEPEIRSFLDELDIPANHIVWSTVVLGYPVNQPVQPARKKDVIRWF